MNEPGSQTRKPETHPYPRAHEPWIEGPTRWLGTGPMQGQRSREALRRVGLALGVLLVTGAGGLWGSPQDRGAPEAERRVERSPEQPGASPEELILQEILALKQRIDSLVEELPPELREEVRRRLMAGYELYGGVEEEEAAPPGGGGEARDPGSREASPLPIGREALTGRGILGEVATELAELGRESRPRPRDPESCNTLWFFDNNQDGELTANDRYWRHFYVWMDDGDGEVEAAETRSLFDADVRAVDVALKHYRGTSDGSGDIDVGVHVILRLPDGAGALTVDAGKIGRWDGPRLLGPRGEELDGLQPFRSSLALREPDGRVTYLSCP